MTTRRRILPTPQLRETLDVLREYGIDLARATIDIRADGVRVSPPAAESPAMGNAFDQWKKKDADRDRAARR